MEKLIFIKKCLKDFDYPNIHNLSEDEIVNIYRKSNRLFLVSWLFKRFNANYEIIIGNRNDKKLLEELMSNYGFCSVNEKDKFIECDLNFNVQINILYKMFKFLSDISAEKNKSTFEAISNDALVNLLNLNTNLFPNFGHIQKLNSVDEHKKELEELKIRIQEFENNNDVNNFSSLDENYKKFKEISENFDNICENLIKNIKGYKNIKDTLKNDIVFDRQSSTILKECNENIKLISKFIKNLNTINNFYKNGEIDISNSICLNQENYAEVEEILKEIKEVLLRDS